VSRRYPRTGTETASARSAPRPHETANGEIEADEHYKRDEPLVALGRAIRNDKHAAVVDVRRASPQEGAQKFLAAEPERPFARPSPQAQQPARKGDLIQVRFGSLCGHKSDISRGPRSADFVAKVVGGFPEE